MSLTEPAWEIVEGEGPLVATAIHDGHEIRADAQRHMALDAATRLREEEPQTAAWTRCAPTRIVGLRSRFEMDLNRPRETAVYLRAEDAWGLRVWGRRTPPEVIAQSLAEHDAFYAALRRLYDRLEARHGRFIVLDLHSYNHRRAGPEAPAADPDVNPQINLGTGTMTDRARWAPVVDRLVADLSRFDFPGGPLDVRENVRFRGGYCARWTHATYPRSACVLSLEVKKTFMDEWTGEIDPRLHDAFGRAIASTVPGLLESLKAL